MPLTLDHETPWKFVVPSDLPGAKVPSIVRRASLASFLDGAVVSADRKTIVRRVVPPHRISTPRFAGGADPNNRFRADSHYGD